MSTRSNILAVAASAGLVATGWASVLKPAELGPAVPAPDTVPAPQTQSASPSAAPPAPTAGGSTAGTSTPSAASPSSPSASPTASSAPKNGLTDGTYTGPTVPFQYGTAQVTITVRDGAITDVSDQVVSDGRRRSDALDAQAVPVLRSEVLSATSGQIDAVSGATYTSDAYESSLQAALDAARA